MKNQLRFCADDFCHYLVNCLHEKERVFEIIYTVSNVFKYACTTTLFILVTFHKTNFQKELQKMFWKVNHQTPKGDFKLHRTLTQQHMKGCGYKALNIHVPKEIIHTITAIGMVSRSCITAAFDRAARPCQIYQQNDTIQPATHIIGTSPATVYSTSQILAFVTKTSQSVDDGLNVVNQATKCSLDKATCSHDWNIAYCVSSL